MTVKVYGIYEGGNSTSLMREPRYSVYGSKEERDDAWDAYTVQFREKFKWKKVVLTVNDG